MTQKIYDIRTASQREFEDFVFDHDPQSFATNDAWYHRLDTTVKYDASHSARCFIEMFRTSASLFEKYDRERLKQGFWAMTGASFDGNLDILIWRSNIAPELKEELIAAMFFVFCDVFARDPMGEACEMWWDALAYCINPMKHVDPVGNPVHKRIQGAMFHTLAQILDLDAADCQSAALHGLNHVLHPDTKALIDDFIMRRPDLPQDFIDYAYHCVAGRAM
ncbi:hypothetical protein [uncultured Sulfitobacter sp.]|uniref:hypothetical protein n=1 Tax=uncultured Sulfitobacter sp. TaxID=191468 RepID=UPI002615918C|nr:hypothetical protein [uncultured Sulfitobacter sp.]